MSSLALPFAAAFLAVVTVAGCSSDGPSSSGPYPYPSQRPGERVAAAERILFRAYGGMKAAPSVILDEQADLRAYARWFRGVFVGPTADDLLQDRGFRDDTIYLAFGARTGCAEPLEAYLIRNRADLTAQFITGPNHLECAAPYGAVVVFALPRDDLPANWTISGAPPPDEIPTPPPSS
jgi:hypothetical protein